MIDLAKQIRSQLNAAPKRRTFTKRRETLLEIAVALECANKALFDMEKNLSSANASIEELRYELDRFRA